jgi:hypothetical protein
MKPSASEAKTATVSAMADHREAARFTAVWPPNFSDHFRKRCRAAMEVGRGNRDRTAWLRMQWDPNSSPLRNLRENNRAKYRGESQKWAKNTGDIVINADSIRISSEIPRKK